MTKKSISVDCLLTIHYKFKKLPENYSSKKAIPQICNGLSPDNQLKYSLVPSAQKDFIQMTVQLLLLQNKTIHNDLL
jgi:hypothetical protein